MSRLWSRSRLVEDARPHGIVRLRKDELQASKYRKMEEQFTRDQNLHMIARLKQDFLAE